MILKISKFGDFLTSRPAGKEAALSCLTYEKGLKTGEEVKLDFTGILVMTPAWLSEFVQTLKEKKIKSVQFLPSENPTVASSIEIIQSEIGE